MRYALQTQKEYIAASKLKCSNKKTQQHNGMKEKKVRQQTTNLYKSEKIFFSYTAPASVSLPNAFSAFLHCFFSSSFK